MDTRAVMYGVHAERVKESSERNTIMGTACMFAILIIATARMDFVKMDTHFSRKEEVLMIHFVKQYAFQAKSQIIMSNRRAETFMAIMMTNAYIIVEAAYARMDIYLKKVRR